MLDGSTKNIPHDFKLVEKPRVTKTNFLSGYTPKVARWVWYCAKCDSKVGFPQFFTTHDINQSMTNRFSCMPAGAVTPTTSDINTKPI